MLENIFLFVIIEDRIKWLTIIGWRMIEFDYIKRNFSELSEEIEKLSGSLGYRVPTLVSVTKSGTDDELLALAAAGALDIGENRPQEVKRRGDILRAAGFQPRMHEIGTLQTNKVKLVIESASLIHSLDSEKLALEINKRAAAIGRKMPVLIEVNSGREEQKGGIFPEKVEEFLEKLKSFENLKLSGLMTMGPLSEEGEALRPYFRETKKLFDRLTPYFDTEEPTLSMGMSDSYRVAIEEGSTLVRVGRRLFKK